MMTICYLQSVDGKQQFAKRWKQQAILKALLIIGALQRTDVNRHFAKH